jgi:hypothetical protein
LFSLRAIVELETSISASCEVEWTCENDSDWSATGLLLNAMGIRLVLRRWISAFTVSKVKAMRRRPRVHFSSARITHRSSASSAYHHHGDTVLYGVVVIYSAMPFPG